MKDHDEEALPDLSVFYLDEDEEEQDLATLMEEDTHDKVSERKMMAAYRDSPRKKTALLVGGGALAFALLTGGALTLTPMQEIVFGGGPSGDKTSTPSAEPTESSSSTSDSRGGSESNVPGDLGSKKASERPFWAADTANRYPVQLSEWQKTTYSQAALVTDPKKNPQGTAVPLALRKQIVNDFADSEIASSGNRLPSEASGYTSNDSKAALPNGDLNPKYSYWTSEEYEATVGIILNRLLIPEFGGWFQYQFASSKASNSLDPALFSDIMTTKYLEDNKDKAKRDYIPVYADWDANDYGLGGQLISNGPRWYGKVESTSSKFSYDDSKNQYTVAMTVKVKYTAWKADQSKLEKTGTLTLQLVPNKDAYAGRSPYKVLINQGNLKVE